MDASRCGNIYAFKYYIFILLICYYIILVNKIIKFFYLFLNTLWYMQIVNAINY
jgi:hypothetical protein